MAAFLYLWNPLQKEQWRNDRSKTKNFPTQKPKDDSGGWGQIGWTYQGFPTAICESTPTILMW